MPVYRGPDGKIIEEKANSGKEVNQSTDSEQRPPAPTGRGQTSSSGRLDAPTQKMDVGSSQSPLPLDEKTQIAGGRRRQQSHQNLQERAEMDVSQSPLSPDEKTRVVGDHRGQQGQQDLQERAEKADGMDDPVVGWLAIVEGPGKGKCQAIGIWFQYHWAWGNRPHQSRFRR